MWLVLLEILRSKLVVPLSQFNVTNMERMGSNILYSDVCRWTINHAIHSSYAVAHQHTSLGTLSERKIFNKNGQPCQTLRIDSLKTMYQIYSTFSVNASVIYAYKTDKDFFTLSPTTSVPQHTISISTMHQFPNDNGVFLVDS